MVEYYSEQQAEKIFSKIFDEINETEPCAFFDYLVKKRNADFIIEVKTAYFSGNGTLGNVVIPEQQAIKLLAQKKFLLFIIDDINKIGLFVSPKRIYEYAHLHANKLNNGQRTIVMKVRRSNNILTLVEPVRCRTCLGSLKDFAIKYEKNEKKIQAVSVQAVQT